MATRFAKWTNQKIGNLCIWKAQAGGVVATVMQNMGGYKRYNWSIGTYAKDGRFLRQLADGESRSLAAAKKAIDTYIAMQVRRGMM